MVLQLHNGISSVWVALRERLPYPQSMMKTEPMALATGFEGTDVLLKARGERRRITQANIFITSGRARLGDHGHESGSETEE